MELTITVVDPIGTSPPADVEVTAAPGTAMSAVLPALFASVGRIDGQLSCGTDALSPSSVLGEPPLLDGAILTVGAPARVEPRALLELHVLAGPDSGGIHPLGPGEHGIGRVADARIRVADPDVSRLHALLRVAVDDIGSSTLHDLGSTNGTTLDGVRVDRSGVIARPGQVVRIGDTRLAVMVPARVPVSCRPDGEGHREFNRPPRQVVPPAPTTVSLPVEPPLRERTRFPLVALAVPLVAGAVLALVTRSPTYLVFILLSPVMVLGTYLSDRAGGRRSRSRARSEHAAALARAEEAVRSALASEWSARHSAHPDAATLLLTARGPRPSLWERRPEDGDYLEVRLGLGTVPSALKVHTPTNAASPGSTVHPDLVDVPATVSLARAGVVGVAGVRHEVIGLACAITAQLAGWHSPRHLGIVVLCHDSKGVDWSWVRWLPHVQPLRGEAATALVGRTPAQLRARIADLLALLDFRTGLGAPPGSWTGRSVVVILDGAGALRRHPGVVRLLCDGPALGIRFLCLERDLVSLPTECRATVEVSEEPRGRLRVRTEDATTYDGVVIDAVDDIWANRFARALAPLRDATPDDRAAGLPTRARLIDLLPVDATSPEALEAQWRVTPRGTAVPLGVATGGEPLVVDLATDGPHVLVAGTTGSGKSELLQTLVTGLAVANRPDEMSFVLIDYKGGSAFADCARLPHTVGMVTDLDSHLTERALQSLGAELRRRERILRAAECADLDEYLHTSSGRAPLPRLVLVVDEFATLVEELPDFVGGLIGVAQRGRSLGVHLVLATQRPGGVVSADIRANTGLRIALRVTDATESRDVIDVRDAADISRSTPGRAVLRTGNGGVRHLQTARVAGETDSHVTEPVARRVSWETAGDPPPRAAAAPASGATDLTRIAVAATEAARRLGVPAAVSPWQPPLPPVVTTDMLDDVVGAVAIGLHDLPREQKRSTLTLGLEGGDHLVVAGGARSGRSSLLRTVAGSVARQDVGDVHLYVFDAGGGSLSSLALLPHCGAVIARDETARGDRLLTLLVEEMERRQQQLAECGMASVENRRLSPEPADRWPWVVLLVDGWENLQNAYEAVDHGRPLDALARLVREAAAVGFRIVITGGRALLTSRVGASVNDRLVLRMPDPTDYGLAGVPLRHVPAHMPAGRALLPDGSAAQLALLPGDPTGAGQVRAIGDLAADTHSASAGPHQRNGPLRVDALPARVGFEDIEAEAAAHAAGPGWTLLGIGGDHLHPMGVDLAAEGPAFVVAGPPGSGRSTVLATMGRWLVHQGRPVVVVSHRRSPLRSLTGTPGVLACLGPRDDVPLRDLLLVEPALTVLADDAETLHDSPVEQPLLALLHPDAETSAALVLAGSAAEMAGFFRGLTVEARRGRAGLLLGSLAPGDGDLLGVRLSRRPAGPTGSGLLVLHGQVWPVQVAHTVI